jgi:hypothetical protein
MCLKNMVGITNLKELVSLVKGARFYIGPDTATMHIDSGLGLAAFVISPFAASGDLMHYNSPFRFGPLSGGRVFRPVNQLEGCDRTCERNYPHCINQVSSDEVIRGLVDHLSKQKNVVGCLTDGG